MDWMLFLPTNQWRHWQKWYTYNRRLIGNHIWPIKRHECQWPWMALKVVQQLQDFSAAILNDLLSIFTRFQMTQCIAQSYSDSWASCSTRFQLKTSRGFYPIIVENLVKFWGSIHSLEWVKHLECDLQINHCVLACAWLRVMWLISTSTVTRSPAVAEGPCEHTVSWNLVKCCTNVRQISLEKVCNRWMTFKDILGHITLVPSDRPHMTSH